MGSLFGCCLLTVTLYMRSLYRPLLLMLPALPAALAAKFSPAVGVWPLVLSVKPVYWAIYPSLRYGPCCVFSQVGAAMEVVGENTNNGGQGGQLIYQSLRCRPCCVFSPASGWWVSCYCTVSAYPTSSASLFMPCTSFTT